MVELIGIFIFGAVSILAFFTIVHPIFMEADEEVRKCEVEIRKHREESRKLDAAYKKRIEILKGNNETRKKT